MVKLPLCGEPVAHPGRAWTSAGACRHLAEPSLVTCPDKPRRGDWLVAHAADERTKRVRAWPDAGPWRRVHRTHTGMHAREERALSRGALLGLGAYA